MSDKIVYSFGDVNTTPHEKLEDIESRGYKRAVKSFQIKYPKVKVVAVEWVKNGVELSKVQKLPMGRKKKVGR
jgi:hypothetical protein|tara:strand:- start:385 stop:603 length:219 start_codon:yes stop_codon:yes gene_type:complete